MYLLSARIMHLADFSSFPRERVHQWPTFHIYKITPLPLLFELLLSSETTWHQYNFISIRLFRSMSIPITFHLFSVMTSAMLGRLLPLLTLLL